MSLQTETSRPLNTEQTATKASSLRVNTEKKNWGAGIFLLLHNNFMFMAQYAPLIDVYIA